MRVCGKDVCIQGGAVRIARLAADGFEFLEDPVALLDALRQSGERIDLFSFIQELPETAPAYRFPMELDNVAALPISTFDDWWNRQINAKTRNMIRRAHKMGVVVREVPFDDALIDGIALVYNESPVRQGKPFAHYRQDLQSLRLEHSTFLERSIFIGAFLGEELIGFIKLVHANSQASLMQIVSMIRHRDKAATNALIAQAVRSCAGRRIPYLVYAKFSNGRNRRDTLSDFKQHNGFQRIDIPRYFVPLTVWGASAFRLRLHHRFTDYIPEPLVAKLRAVRTLWYKHRLQAQRQVT